MKLDSIVPWGRTLSEYRRMFDLTNQDLEKKILGIGDGPASFNAEMTQTGYSVISIDPIYAFSKEEIASRIAQTRKTITDQIRLDADRYNWIDFKDADDLSRQRINAMDQFLADYAEGLRQKRYRTESLPVTSLSTNAFDLALCSHFLFLYTDHLTAEFHIQAVREMVRVAKDVRIFPLVDLNARLSSYVSEVSADCRANQCVVEVVEVPYHFQKNGNQMLRIVKR